MGLGRGASRRRAGPRSPSPSLLAAVHHGLNCLQQEPYALTMKSVALYLLAALGGNSAPSADDLKKIAGSGAQQGLSGRGGGGCGPSMQRALRRQAAARPGAAAGGGRYDAALGPAVATAAGGDRHRFRAPCSRSLSSRCAAAVGIELDAERVSKLLSELEGKNIDEVHSRVEPSLGARTTAA